MTDISNYTPITFRRDLSNYLINKNGDIYSLRLHRALKRNTNGQGYISYTLQTDKGKMIKVMAHVAVARQYISNPDPKHKTIVNHIDEDKSNSSVENLEWVTPSENARHGTGMKRAGDKRKRPVNEYLLNGTYLRTWKSVRDVVTFYADLWGCDPKGMKSIESSIQQCCSGYSATSHGRVWKYFDGETTDIEAPKGRVNEVGMTYSKSKLKLDYTDTVPAEYLYHKPTKAEIVEYFMNHDRLTDYEKGMIKQLL